MKLKKQKNGGGASQDWGGGELGTPCVGPQLEAPVCAFRALQTHPGLYVRTMPHSNDPSLHKRRRIKLFTGERILRKMYSKSTV